MRVVGRRPAAAGAGRGHSAGQATVELALLLPLLLVLVLLAVQVGVVVRDRVLLVHVTREAARAAAVGASPPSPPDGGLDPARLAVHTVHEGNDVRAVGHYRSAVVIPLLAAWRGSVELRAEVTMRSEVVR